MTLRERFNAKYEPAPNGCWLWTAALTKNGYGKLGRSGERGWDLAHRVSWELHRGPIPEGLTIDHLCRVRHCVNPAHLDPVPMRTNILRGESPTAIRAAKTHCKRGHEFTPENTYVTTQGFRQCRTCARERDRARWPARRAEQNALRRIRKH